MAEEIREEELERIRQLEASPEYQEKLRILREKMRLISNGRCIKVH